MQSGATDYLIKSELNSEKLERCIRYSLDRAASLKILKERETKYRNLFENSKDALFIADTKLNLLEFNHAATVLLGYKSEELVGKSLYEFIRTGNQRDAILKFLKYGANFTDIQIEIENNNKDIKPCLISISFQKSSEDKWLVHGIIHDITNLKNTELANIQSQKLAATERLMRVLAHEIRNPLNNINLSVQQYELLYDDADKQKNFVEIIQRNCNRINQSITELLNLTKMQELNFEKHSLQDILNESISSVEDRISLQKVKIEKKFNGQVYEIAADKSKLKIAFSNILVNAIEAMEENKGQLAVSLSSSPDWFTVSIKDNGVGIPEESLSRLFEPFFTLKKNGMGLGLAASYYIFQSHKAKIQVESKVNQGTNFIISFVRSN
jgi:PAS domain S-box-containing protein